MRMHVALGGEGYVALAEGPQNAPWALGGAPREHRSDSLSAAFRDLGREAAEDLTRRYDALCARYGMQPSRGNPGLPHENGAVGGAHGHPRAAIADALCRCARLARLCRPRRLPPLRRRGGRAAQRPLGAAHRGRARRAAGAAAAAHRRPRGGDRHRRRLPSGGFVLRKVFYGVPSRPIGNRPRARLSDDRLEVSLGGSHQMTLPRAAGRVRMASTAGHVVD